jgi:hypothetical protein
MLSRELIVCPCDLYLLVGLYTLRASVGLIWVVRIRVFGTPKRPSNRVTLNLIAIFDSSGDAIRKLTETWRSRYSYKESDRVCV